MEISNSKRTDEALARLAELGVQVEVHNPSGVGGSYILKIPHDLLSPAYMEIGYLLAQLAHPQLQIEWYNLSDIPSKIHRRQAGSAAQVEFRDSYPEYLKYSVRMSGR